ncbi:MAG: ATP-binding protein, partial [Chloroflexota bacterium]
GYANDPDRRCTCPTGDPERYVRRVSGPLLDRLDMQVEMARVPVAQLIGGLMPETSATVRGRIIVARHVALTRNAGRPNAQLPGRAVMAACQLGKAGVNVLTELSAMNHLSARQVHRLLRVARTIADLAGRAAVSEHDVLAAAMLRDPARPIDDRLAA